MSDIEYDTLMELYQELSFEQLCVSLGLESSELKPILKRMIDKDLVAISDQSTKGLKIDDSDYELNYRRYYYFASRKGLEAYHQ